MDNHLISLMVLLPLLGVVFQAFLPRFEKIPSEATASWLALISSAAAGVAGFFLVATMNPGVPEPQAVESLSWVGAYSISYEMGVDGLNALLVLLIAIIFPVLIAAEWNQPKGARGMFALLLLLQSALTGAACAQDLFLMFFFWGIAALPVYFLIGIWGGAGREGAAFRTLVVASIGNALLFAAIMIIYYSAEPNTFLLKDLIQAQLADKTLSIFGHSLSVGPVVLGLLAAGLAARIAVWPLHGWFIDVAKEAPTSVFVTVSAATVPVGLYLFTRFSYSLFPATLSALAPAVVWVGAINIAIGVISALAQKDLRGLLAYLCIAETGLALVGIGSLSSAGLVGAIYQELAVGLGLAGFGLLTGILGSRAGHTVFGRNEDERRFGGAVVKAPMIAMVAGVFVAALLGVPGFGSFISRSLVFLGGYPEYPAAIVVAGVALLLSTFCLFVVYRKIFLGEPGHEMESITDLSFRERAYLLPLVATVIFFGVYPKPLLDLVRPTALTLLSLVK